MSARKAPKDKQIKKDYKTMSSQDMAIKYGMTRASICRHLRRLKITRPLSGPNSRNKKRKGEVFKSGYPVLHLPDHERASAVGYVFKHILEVKKHTGKIPKKTTPIHHIDLKRTNYNIENLYVCKNNSEHQLIHASLNELMGELIKKNVIEFKDGKYLIK